MNCNEASEYVSALCDGETIPPEAAAHIGSCATCRDLLAEYIEMGAELRRVASLEIHETTQPLVLNTPRRHPFLTAWWQKGLQSMRIPRIAFALLVIGIVALASTLVIGKVRARSEGNVVAMRVDFGSGQPMNCFLDAAKTPPDACGGVTGFNSRALSFQFEILARDGDRYELGVRSRTSLYGSPEATSDVHQESQQQLWFTPGESTKVALAGGASATVTGEWTDHVPPFFAQNANPNLDPNPTELRINSPLLLRDEDVVGDMEGAGAEPTGPDSGVVIYFPSAGRFIFSLNAIPGAVAGKVRENRIAFDINGRHYALITGAPVSRANHVWVLYQPDFKPDQSGARGFLGAGTLKFLLQPSRQ